MKTFKTLDLLFFTLLAIVTELIGFYALKKYPGAGFSLSLTLLVTVIAMIRWGTVGALVYPLASVALVFVYWGTTSSLFLVVYYPLAGCFAFFSGFIFQLKNPNAIKSSKALFVLFQFVLFVSLALAKGLATLLFWHNFSTGFWVFVLNYGFSWLIGVIVSLFLLKREGLIQNLSFV